MKRYSMRDITPETIIKTREYGIKQCQACMEEAVSGKVWVNDIESYKKMQQTHMDKYESGYYDDKLHFLSKAIYIQFGESVPIMSK